MCWCLRLQFDVVLAAYKKKSSLWNPTLNKFAEGELFLPASCEQPAWTLAVEGNSCWVC